MESLEVSLSPRLDTLRELLVGFSSDDAQMCSSAYFVPIEI